MVTWRHCFSIKLPQATWLVTLFLWGLNDSQLFSEDLGRFLKSHRILTSYMHQICPEERIDSHKKNCSQSLQLWECLADVFTSVCNIVRRLTSRENGCVRAYLQTSDAQWDMGFGNQQLNENDPLPPQRKKKKETAKINFVGLGQSWKNWADKLLVSSISCLSECSLSPTPRNQNTTCLKAARRTEVILVRKTQGNMNVKVDPWDQLFSYFSCHDCIPPQTNVSGISNEEETSRFDGFCLLLWSMATSSTTVTWIQYFLRLLWHLKHLISRCFYSGKQHPL